MGIKDKKLTLTKEDWIFLLEENGFKEKLDLSNSRLFFKSIKPQYHCEALIIETDPTLRYDALHQKYDVLESDNKKNPVTVRLNINNGDILNTAIWIKTANKNLNIKNIENSLYLENLITQRIYRGRYSPNKSNFTHSIGEWKRIIKDCSNYRVVKTINVKFVAKFKLEKKSFFHDKNGRVTSMWIKEKDITESNVFDLNNL